METAPCPISGSADFTLWLQVPDRFDATGKEQWTLLHSCASGLIMLNPRPDSSEIAHHYHTGQYDPHLHVQNSATRAERAYLAARSVLLRYRARIILKECRKPLQHVRVLEIGSSTGELLNYFHQKKGIPLSNLVGVEPEPEAAEYALTVFGLKVYPSLSDAGDGEMRFDRMVLWHTLEHIHAIHETLDYAAKQLAPNGVLIIALPNPESYDAKHYQENWIAWDAPRHLYHFVPETLEKLLDKYQMSIFKQLTYFPDTLYNNFHSEKLRCKRVGKSFTVLRMSYALCRALVDVVKGVFWPGEASSFIYYAKKDNRTLKPDITLSP
jgi:2-polyprenyl-3-methyl-5-hydroxy-6-metoxy-1,4-benzoquinol methylase